MDGMDLMDGAREDERTSQSSPSCPASPKNTRSAPFLAGSCSIAFRPVATAPEGVARILALARETLAHRSAAFRTGRHQFFRRSKLASIPCLDAGSAHSFRKATLLDERLDVAFHLTPQERGDRIDGKQDSVGSGHGILRLEHRRVSRPHTEKVFPEGMANVSSDRNERVEAKCAKGRNAGMVVGPRRDSTVKQERLEVAGQLLKARLGHVKEIELGFGRDAGPGRGLHQILPRRTSRADHLPDCLAQRVVPIVVVPSAERGRRVIDETRHPE